jgi:hypothetical protein
MAKRIQIVGAKPKRIEVLDQPRRRIDPAELAAALGANPTAGQSAEHLDLITLAELGTQLLDRLRSSGGRPALADATEICRVPLSTDDLTALERINEQIEQATGTKASLGQVASAIVREYLTKTRSSESPVNSMVAKSAWPEAWNGNREKYRRAQELVEQSKSTWGGKAVV